MCHRSEALRVVLMLRRLVASGTFTQSTNDDRHRKLIVIFNFFKHLFHETEAGFEKIPCFQCMQRIELILYGGIQGLFQ